MAIRTCQTCHGVVTTDEQAPAPKGPGVVHHDPDVCRASRPVGEGRDQYLESRRVRQPRMAELQDRLAAGDPAFAIWEDLVR